MNKKAYVFVYSVVVLTFIALLGAFFVLTVKYKLNDAKGQTRIIGTEQAEVFSAYQRGENARFYVLQSAKLSAKQAVNDLAADSGCGVYHGYSIWSDEENECFPEKETLKEKFKEKLNENLKSYTEKYNDASIPASFEFSMYEEDKIKIISTSPNPITLSLKSKIKGEQKSNLPVSFVWPAYGLITSCYGYRELASKSNDWHDGIDIGISAGTNIISVADGTVEKTCNEWIISCACSIAIEPGKPGACENKALCNGRCGNYGNYVIIKHTDNFYTRYSHLSEIRVKEGQKVKKTQLIAKSGNTGLSEGPHLDFKIYFSNDFSSDLGKGSYERNPLCYLPVLSEDKFTADSCKDSDGTGIQFCSLKPDIIKATTNPDNNIYSVKPDFKLNIDYSFDEYDNLIETSKKIAEEATQKCYKGGVDFDKCINGLLDRKTDFKWSFACVKTEDEESVSNRMLRLCAESKYKLSSLGSLQNPIYKIAVFAGDTIPPEPVKNVKAENTLGAEENITISFDANAEPDIDYYVVYYSENQFTSVTDEGVLGLGNVEHKGTETHSKTFKIPEDKKTYYFAVAAVDTSGNEGEFEAPISGISEDNLNPGSVELITFERAPGEAPQINVFITPPEENTDKTKLKDLEKYLFYLKETSAALCTLNDVKDALKTKIETISLNMLAVPNKALIELPDAQKAYCLVVIAEDEEPAISLSDETAMRPRYSEKSIVSVKI